MKSAPWGVAVAGVLLVSACADDAPNGATTAPPPPTATAAETPPAPSTSPAAPEPEPEPEPEPPDDGLELLSTGQAFTAFVPPPELAPLAVQEQYWGPYEDFSASPVLVAAKHATLDVVASRASYDEPIAVTARVGSHRVVLPDGAVEDWNGLERFFDVVIVDKSGTTVFDDSIGFCPERGGRLRVGPDGPVESSPYGECGLNPLGIGARWTLDEGWATTVLPDLSELGIAPGEYRLEIAVTDDYRPLFTGATVVSVPMTVEAEDIEFYLSGVDSDGDGLDDAVDPDLDGDGIEDTADDDVFAGLGSDVDDDGIDDRPGGVAFVDLGADGDDGEFVDEAIDGEEPEDEPAHVGRTGPVARPPLDALPDLRSLPAFGIGAFADEESGLDLLSFAAITWNSGPSPMVVDGFARADQPDVMDAYQQFGRVPGVTTPYAGIGTLEFHAGGGHDHWHFSDFARYDLLTEDGEQLQRSGKESWCLVDTDAIDLRSKAAREVVAGTLESSCGDRGALWVRETLGVGWGDQYDQSRSGQAFDITDLPNGRYLIRISANPTGSIYEISTTNNVADRLVILGGRPGARTVEVPPVGLVDTEDDIVSGSSDFEPEG